MSLQSIPIANQLDWLATAGLRNDASLAADLPRGFDAYLKILRPLGVDRCIPLAEYSFSTKSVEALNRRVQFWNKYQIIGGQPLPQNLERISYQEVAATIGATYDAGFGDTAISQFYGGWPPNLGTSAALNDTLIQSLAELIGLTKPVYFYGASNHGMYHFNSQDAELHDWLYAGIAADLAVVFQREQDYPTYTFATDHSWCLHHSEDADWLVLGCSTEIAAKINSSELLETFLLAVA